MNRPSYVLILAMAAFWLCVVALGVRACESGGTTSMVEQILVAITPALESEPFP